MLTPRGRVRVSTQPKRASFSDRGKPERPEKTRRALHTGSVRPGREPPTLLRGDGAITGGAAQSKAPGSSSPSCIRGDAC